MREKFDVFVDASGLGSGEEGLLIQVSDSHDVCSAGVNQLAIGPSCSRSLVAHLSVFLESQMVSTQHN